MADGDAPGSVAVVAVSWLQVQAACAAGLASPHRYGLVPNQFNRHTLHSCQVRLRATSPPGSHIHAYLNVTSDAACRLLVAISR